MPNCAFHETHNAYLRLEKICNMPKQYNLPLHDFWHTLENYCQNMNFNGYGCIFVPTSLPNIAWCLNSKNSIPIDLNNTIKFTMKIFNIYWMGLNIIKFTVPKGMWNSPITSFCSYLFLEIFPFKTHQLSYSHCGSIIISNLTPFADFLDSKIPTISSK